MAATSRRRTNVYQGVWCRVVSIAHKELRSKLCYMQLEPENWNQSNCFCIQYCMINSSILSSETAHVSNREADSSSNDCLERSVLNQCAMSVNLTRFLEKYSNYSLPIHYYFWSWQTLLQPVYNGTSEIWLRFNVPVSSKYFSKNRHVLDIKIHERAVVTPNQQRYIPPISSMIWTSPPDVNNSLV